MMIKNDPQCAKNLLENKRCTSCIFFKKNKISYKSFCMFKKISFINDVDNTCEWYVEKTKKRMENNDLEIWKDQGFSIKEIRELWVK